MSIMSKWYNEEENVILTVFDSEWTWNDFHAAVREVHKMVATVPHRVDLVMLHKVDQPLGNPMVHFRKAFENQPANTGKVVVVNPKVNPAVRRFITILANVFEKTFPAKSKVFIVETLEEADALLARPRTTEEAATRS